MPQHRPTTDSSIGVTATVGLLALLLGCSRPLPSSEEDSQDLPDLPADMPVEDTEIEGILYGIDYEAEPTRFVDPCEYPAAPGDVDTCGKGLRCWNAAGDLSQPGVCVPYCDLSGELGPACDGTCVQCSSSERGLCVSGCSSGEDCSVDAFC